MTEELHTEEAPAKKAQAEEDPRVAGVLLCLRAPKCLMKCQRDTPHGALRAARYSYTCCFFCLFFASCAPPNTKKYTNGKSRPMAMSGRA